MVALRWSLTFTGLQMGRQVDALWVRLAVARLSRHKGHALPQVRPTLARTWVWVRCSETHRAWSPSAAVPDAALSHTLSVPYGLHETVTRWPPRGAKALPPRGQSAALQPRDRHSPRPKEAAYC